MAEMRKFTAYLSLLCPDSEWNAGAEKVFDDLFHPDVVIVGKDSKFDFAAWKEWYKRSIQQNLQVDMIQLKFLDDHGEHSILYTMHIHLDDGSILPHTARGFFQDGKLIRTEPVDPKIYDIMTKTKKNNRIPVSIL